MSQAVVIFARSPEGEARAKGLPRRTGATLFRAVVASWVRAARRAGATPIIASEAADRPALMAIAGESMWIEQRGDRFGERLASAAAQVFAAGFRGVVIGGIDTPPPDDMGAIFGMLDHGTPAVVAPARDGGVNLIGLSVPALDALRTIEQGQRDTVARFRERFPDLVTLAVQSDIDSRDDIEVASLERGWIAFRTLLFACSSRFAFFSLISNAERRAPAVHISRAPPRAF